MKNDCIKRLDECLSCVNYKDFTCKMIVNTSLNRNVFRINGYNKIRDKLQTRKYEFKQLKILPQHKLIIMEVEEVKK